MLTLEPNKRKYRDKHRQALNGYLKGKLKIPQDKTQTDKKLLQRMSVPHRHYVFCLFH